MAIQPTSFRPTSAARLTQPQAQPGELNPEAAKAAVASKHLLSIRRPNDVEQVKEMKRLLKAKGYDAGDVASGTFDEKALAAVANFQAENNLSKDGLVGQQTWAALLGVPHADQIPPGHDWLGAWTERLARRGDLFLDAEAPAGISLGASLKPENATDAPLYRQGDPRWGNRTMSQSSALRSKGCAVTAMASALSGATGKELNPGQLDEYLDRHGGYAGNNNINWAVAAQAAGASAQRVSQFSINDLEKSLQAKRPVVIGVDYKRGEGTDHWLTIKDVGMDTKGQKVFLANDSATGEVVRLYPNPRGGLSSYAGGMGDYRTTGDAVFIG